MRLRLIGKRIGQIAIALLILASAAELGFYLYVHSGNSLYSTRDLFPMPSGYLLDKRFMAATAAPCYILRISSDDCPFCRQDQVRYIQLVQKAQSIGCKAAVLAPTVGQMKRQEAGEIPQLQYIDMEMGRALKPFITPETLLLDAKGRLKWQRVGAMDDRSLALALRALEMIR